MNTAFPSQVEKSTSSFIDRFNARDSSMSESTLAVPIVAAVFAPVRGVLEGHKIKAGTEE